MKSVSFDSIFVAEFLGKGVAFGVFWNGGMEGGVEDAVDGDVFCGGLDLMDNV